MTFAAPETPLLPEKLRPLQVWAGPDGLPDYGRIADNAFDSAFEAAMALHDREIAAIADNPEAPTIENTLLAYEMSGDALGRVAALFFNKASADTNDVIRALERAIAPKLSAHYSKITMNRALFARFEALDRNRETLALDAETARVLDNTLQGFVRAGARLGADDQSRLAAINSRLAELGATFGQNVLKDESDTVIWLESADVEGLPTALVRSLAEAARTRGGETSHAVTMSRSHVEPFLASSPRRDLRQKVFEAFIARGDLRDETRNAPVIAETLALRAEKAKLLGYRSFADFKLERSMAKTPANVRNLLEPVWEAARAKAAAEAAMLAEDAAQDGLNAPLAPWDWRYHAERVRARTHDFDEAALKPYLPLDAMIAAAFDVAGRLFGLAFEPLDGVAAWHPDTRVWRVRDADGSERGLFIGDYFARPSKRSGAWMSALQSQHGIGDGQTPIIYNVCNFAKPATGETALLSFDEARTLFHEFGHALHGLLSNVTWPSIAGTAVYRDFVELPSQLFEHWLTVPEILKRHARHVETGEPMPDALVGKLLAARSFNAGFDAVEFTASALVDMAFHERAETPSDPLGFEADELARLAMPEAIAMRHASPHFQHVFAGDGYSAGYYSYLWSEVLDADAFAAFEEAGDPFDPVLAERLRTSVYGAGASDDPEALYTAFRGRMPAPDAMMRKRGLVVAAE